jgi:hypothetical protein
MTDLDIEINHNYDEASIIEEANSKLQPVHRAGRLFRRKRFLLI